MRQGRRRRRAAAPQPAAALGWSTATRRCRRAGRVHRRGRAAARAHWLRFSPTWPRIAPDEIEQPLRAGRPAHPRHRRVLPRLWRGRASAPGRSSRLPLLIDDERMAARSRPASTQRAELLEAVLADLYGDAPPGRRRRAAGGGGRRQRRIPAAAASACEPPGGRLLQLYAADLGRGPDGRWWVLERPRAGAVGRRLCAREPAGALARLPDLYDGMNVERLAPFFGALRDGLRAARPSAASRASAC